METNNQLSKYQEETEVLPLLEDVILKLTESLERYSKRPQANPFYVDRQNEILSQLHEVYQTIHSFRYLSTWLQIEQTMQNIEDADCRTGGHAIYFRTRDTGEYHSVIDINWFK